MSRPGLTGSVQRPHQERQITSSRLQQELLVHVLEFTIDFSKDTPTGTIKTAEMENAGSRKADVSMGMRYCRFA